jgi:hypothetical protein
MHKNLQHLHGGVRGFAAAAAIASLAAFGCSTNRTPGDGQPAMTAPATPSSTPGTSSGTSNPPMASAYTEGLNVERANDSAAIMAAHQRERFLGTINPSGPQPNPPQPQATGQFIPPSAYANPQATVNASISSAPTPVITGGNPSDGAIFLGGVTTGAATGTTAAATIGATTGTTTTTAATAPALATTGVTATPTTAAIAATPTVTNTTATPTAAAIAATPGQFAAGPTGTTAATGATTTILTPTLTSSVTPTPTRATTTLGALRVNQAGTTTTAASTSSATTSSTATRTSGTARVVAPIRVVTNANGTVTVTNVTTTPPTVISNHK